MVMNKEEALRQAYLDGEKHNQLINNLKDKMRKFSNFFVKPYYVNDRLKDIDAESSQKDYLQIKSIEKRYLGAVSQPTIDLINNFEENHESLCFLLANLNQWGQE